MEVRLFSTLLKQRFQQPSGGRHPHSVVTRSPLKMFFLDLSPSVELFGGKQVQTTVVGRNRPQFRGRLLEDLFEVVEQHLLAPSL